VSFDSFFVFVILVMMTNKALLLGIALLVLLLIDMSCVDAGKHHKGRKGRDGWKHHKGEHHRSRCFLKDGDWIYNLRALRLQTGSAPYVFNHTHDGSDEVLEFNVCGNLTGTNTKCSSPSAACLQTTDGESINIAIFNSSRDMQITTLNNTFGVQMIFTSEQAPNASCSGPVTTVFKFVCINTWENKTQLLQVDDMIVDNCGNREILIETPVACPIAMADTDEMPAGVVVFTLLPICLCVACSLACCCACLLLRRKKTACKKLQTAEMNEYKFEPLPTSETATSAPSAPQFVPVQYYYVPQQVQPQQPQQTSPQVANDEELARKLQAQFDREAQA
jgi:hypothetical protein